MKNMRWHVRVVVAVLALVILAIPSIASAQDTTTAPLQPQFSIPGVLALTLGNTETAEGNKLNATVDVPAINASAVVKGLVLGPMMIPSGWDSVSLVQSKPLETQSLNLSGTQLAVGGANTGYSTDLYTTIDLHPSDALQINGTVGLRYDGLAKSMGLGIRDGNATINTGAANIALTGMNTGQGTFSADTAQITTQAGGAITVSGLTTGPTGLGWDAIDVNFRPMTIGNVLTISPTQLRLGGTDQAYSTAATIGVALNLGEASSVSGDLTLVRDGVTQQTQFALQNGVMTVAVPGFSVGIDGIDTTQGMAFDSVQINVERAGLSAEMTNVVVSPTTGFTFDTATITMQPQGGQGGFQMTLTKTDTGYLMQTTSMIPSRQ
jgi:hypothetical protein